MLGLTHEARTSAAAVPLIGGRLGPTSYPTPQLTACLLTGKPNLTSLPGGSSRRPLRCRAWAALEWLVGKEHGQHGLAWRLVAATSIGRSSGAAAWQSGAKMAPERPNMHARHVLWGVVTRTSNAATDAASMTRVVWSGWAEVAVAREEAVAEVGVRGGGRGRNLTGPEANLHGGPELGSKRTNERAAADGRCGTAEGGGAARRLCDGTHRMAHRARCGLIGPQGDRWEGRVVLGGRSKRPVDPPSRKAAGLRDRTKRTQRVVRAAESLGAGSIELSMRPTEQGYFYSLARRGRRRCFMGRRGGGALTRGFSRTHSGARDAPEAPKRRRK